MKNHEEIKSLFHLIADGDKIAFSRLFDMYYPKLVNFACLYVHSESVAEDLVSELFYQLLKRKSRFAKVVDPNQYLYQSVKYQCFHYIKKKKVLSDESIPDQSLNPNPETIFIFDEFYHLVQKVIEQMPTKRKRIYLMIKDDGMKYKEVADLLNLSVKTVESQMRLAVQTLRETSTAYLKSTEPSFGMKKSVNFNTSFLFLLTMVIS